MTTYVVAFAVLIGCGGPLSFVGLIMISCNTPPPLGPMRDRLPTGVEIYEESNWCGAAPDSAPGEFFFTDEHCTRFLVVGQPGLDSDELLGRLKPAYAGFGYNSVDHSFGITTEIDAWPDRNDRGAALIFQSRGC